MKFKMPKFHIAERIDAVFGFLEALLPPAVLLAAVLFSYKTWLEITLLVGAP